MTVGARVKERRKAAGFSQPELARRVQLSQATIAGLEAGTARSSAHLHRIARELSTTPAYLEGETDDPSEGALPTPTPQLIAEQLDLVPIAEIDLAYGLGGTFTDGPIEQSVRHFPRSFIEAITASPATYLTFTRGRGDSMEPTIRDNDLVLIDRSQKSVREQDAIWALTIGEIGMIKRLNVRGGAVTILSDNERVPTDQANHDEVNIVGRVVFIGRRM